VGRDLGDEGWIPLEIRWQHDPDSAQGFVGATLSSEIIRFARDDGGWSTGKVIDVANEELEGWPLEGGVPGLITDLVLADGTYALDPDFFVDFHEQADGARPHEIHLPGGDCTTEIFQ
jgi:56kDa selenium binding protein (SBP56)